MDDRSVDEERRTCGTHIALIAEFFQIRQMRVAEESIEEHRTKIAQGDLIVERFVEAGAFSQHVFDFLEHRHQNCRQTRLDSVALVANVLEFLQCGQLLERSAQSPVFLSVQSRGEQQRTQLTCFFQRIFKFVCRGSSCCAGLRIRCCGEGAPLLYRCDDPVPETSQFLFNGVFAFCHRIRDDERAFGQEQFAHDLDIDGRSRSQKIQMHGVKTRRPSREQIFQLTCVCILQLQNARVVHKFRARDAIASFHRPEVFPAVADVCEAVNFAATFVGQTEVLEPTESIRAGECRIEFQNAVPMFPLARRFVVDVLAFGFFLGGRLEFVLQHAGQTCSFP